MQSGVFTAGAQDRGRTVEELERELAEAHRREAATREILSAIAVSAVDVRPVFDVIARCATELTEATNSGVFRFDGDLINLVAHHRWTAEALAAVQHVFPIPPGRGSVTARAIETSSVVHVVDLLDDPEYTATPIAEAGFRTVLSVPMLSKNGPIGAISVTRMECHSFSDHQISLLQTFAQQAVIAVENAQLFQEVQSRTRDQTATNDVLNVISRSPGDIQSVMDMIARTSRRLCESEYANIFLREGEHFRCRFRDDGVALQGQVGAVLTEALLSPGRDTMTGRVALERRVVHVQDVKNDPKLTYFRDRGVEPRRTALGVPLLRNDEVIGVINVGRSEKKPFTTRQIDLLETFARQAVIAIENARLFDELQARTRELRESLEFQTATGEVLHELSRSAFDLQAVLDAIVSTAARLCNADHATIFRLKNGKYHVVSSDRAEAAFLELLRDNPIGPGRGTLVGRTALERRTVHVPDALADSEFTWLESQRIGNYRSMLGVPLLHQDEVIGVIGLVHCTVKPFTAKEIDLVTTFADQAVIAIENARLFDEVQEKNRQLVDANSQLTDALEQQTATAEILRVINRSQTDVQPVFERVVRNATTLCGSILKRVPV